MDIEIKKIIKNENGITLLALVTIIVVLIILSSIIVNVSKDSIKESKEDVMISELSVVQNAVLQRKTKIEAMNLSEDTEADIYPGERITDAGIDISNVVDEINSDKADNEEDVALRDNNNSNYYVLSNENGGLKDLGLSSSEDEYIVNYETGEVLNYTTKLTVTGIPLYIHTE